MEGGDGGPRECRTVFIFIYLVGLWGRGLSNVLMTQKIIGAASDPEAKRVMR